MARLVFDAQVLQTPAWHRGMGKYSFELIRAMARRNQESMRWEVIDVLLSSARETDRALLDDLRALPRVKVHKLNLDPNDILHPAVTAAHNRTVIDEFVSHIGGDVSFIILSLMQGEVSPTFPVREKVQKIVLFYDLIPLMFHKIYLQNPITRTEYLSKLEELLRADTYLAISKTVANDLSIYLGIDPERIVSIDGGPIAHGTKSEPIDIPHPFILMPTGNDLRKNNRRGIEGFNLFNKKHNNQYILVITSYFEDWQIKELSRLSERIVFTGNISGSQLNYLYKEAEAVLFPSEYEGLGLPVLEALEKGTPVACSDISVFREISKSAFSYFDHRNIHSIAEGLQKAIGTRPSKQSAGDILGKYSWANTARIAEEAVTPVAATDDKKEKLLVVGVDFSGDNRVGKMILQAHASFSRQFDVVYSERIRPQSVERRINFLPYITNMQAIEENTPLFTEHYDRVPVYHLTNQKESIWVLLGVLARPGIVVLHDLDMRAVWRELKDRNLVSLERHNLELEIDKVFAEDSGRWLGSIVAHQKAVVVFSEQAEKEIEAMVKKMNRPVRVVSLALPANNLVYSDIVTPKKGTSLPIEDTRGVDDIEYETLISKVEALLMPPNATSTDELLRAVEASKYSLSNLPGYREFSDGFAELIATCLGGEK